jgi:hypothetical protein
MENDIYPKYSNIYNYNFFDYVNSCMKVEKSEWPPFNYKNNIEIGDLFWSKCVEYNIKDDIILIEDRFLIKDITKTYDKQIYMNLFELKESINKL